MIWPLSYQLVLVATNLHHLVHTWSHLLSITSTVWINIVVLGTLPLHLILDIVGYAIIRLRYPSSTLHRIDARKLDYFGNQAVAVIRSKYGHSDPLRSIPVSIVGPTPQNTVI